MITCIVMVMDDGTSTLKKMSPTTELESKKIATQNTHKTHMRIQKNTQSYTKHTKYTQNTQKNTRIEGGSIQITETHTQNLHKTYKSHKTHKSITTTQILQATTIRLRPRRKRKKKTPPERDAYIK